MTYLRSQSYQVLESGNKYEPLLLHCPCYLTLFYNVNSYLLSILSFYQTSNHIETSYEM